MLDKLKVQGVLTFLEIKQVKAEELLELAEDYKTKVAIPIEKQELSRTLRVQLEEKTNIAISSKNG